MKTNIGKADRIIRTILALIFVVLYFTESVNGIIGVVLMSLAIVFTATSFVGFCPLYLPFKLNTKSKSEK